MPNTKIIVQNKEIRLYSQDREDSVFLQYTDDMLLQVILRRQGRQFVILSRESFYNFLALLNDAKDILEHDTPNA